MSKFDSAIVWSLFWGVWFLTVTLFGKDIGTDGPISFGLTMIVGFTVAYFTKPILASCPRYALILMIILVWWYNIFLLFH